MLNAILKGKAGRMLAPGAAGDPADDGAGLRWRDIFHFNEDLLTATFFEHLSYLPGDDLVSLLRLAAGAE